MATKKPRLSPLQRAFVREFVSNPDPRIRCNASAAFKAAGGRWTTEASARASASILLKKVKVQHAIATAHAQAEAALLCTLRDWKAAAVAAQPDLLALARGYLPDGRLIQTTADAALGHVVLGALREILDRGFPKRLFLNFDPREALAKLLGVSQDRFPESWDEPEDT
jgi:hypothetical protein